jgi:Tfp pilus assembly protein PilF
VSFFTRSFLITVLCVACHGQNNMDNLSVFDPDGHVLGAHPVEMLRGSQGLPGRAPIASDETLAPQNTEASGSAPITGTISVGNLAKPPSKTAVKYLNKAQRYSEAGDIAKAIEVLRSAPLDPAGAPYLHSRLGTEYLKSHQFQLAVPELEEAVRLLPKEPAHHSNLAYAYQALGQMERAEKEARLAVELDHSNSKAHFILGSILLDRPSGVKEATANLKLARREIPSARFLLAQVYLIAGQREAAKIELDDFLSVATEAQQKIAQQWIAIHSVHPNQASESAK